MSDESQPSLTLDDPIVSDLEILGGHPVFRGTRVPVEVLFENLADGMSLDEILDQFRTLDRKDVVRVLELAAERLTARSGCTKAVLDEGVPRDLAGAPKRVGIAAWP